MNGLYYYKLVSPYSEDVTKNCKLTVNEIDNNFLTLKDADIKSAEIDKEGNVVVLTRNNGDKLIADLTPVLSGAVYDLNIVYENPSETSGKGADLYITYSTLAEDDSKVTVTIPINGLVTTDNIRNVLDDLSSTVITDNSLTGKGTSNSPLGISDLYNNSKPVIKLVDKTVGDVLPDVATKGDKYVTKEYISDYGYLYNFNAVKKINEALEAEGKGWRVPTKADWDCLLNSIEPCDYRNHDSAICHQTLGKYAGTKLKSACGWMNQEECKCTPTEPVTGSYCGGNNEDEVAETDEFDVELVKSPTDGIDEFGMRILPTGFGDGDEIEGAYYKKKTAFWTTTHVNNDTAQDIYIKEFSYNKSGVMQEAQCPDALYAIRLVKDYDGNNHFDSETIDGNNYQTKLFADCGAIWTTTNFASTKESYNAKIPNDAILSDIRVVYFVNMWNGEDWEKRMLNEGETITIQEPMADDEKCQYNVDYRVFKADECNQILVNDDNAVTVRILDEVVPLIDEESDERKAADEELEKKIDEAVSSLTESLSAETEERKEFDEFLQKQIEEGQQAREQVEQQLWDAINGEAENRAQVEQQIWEAIEKEANARQEVDNQQWGAISGETARAQSVEADLWKAINDEAAARDSVDQQIWSNLLEEIRTRERIDNEQWDAINAEVERAKGAEQLLEEKIEKEIADRIADVDEEEARAKDEEKRIEDQIIDNPENAKNDDTVALGEDGYVMKVTDGITLFSKGGTNDIAIKFDADFGTF